MAEKELKFSSEHMEQVTAGGRHAEKYLSDTLGKPTWMEVKGLGNGQIQIRMMQGSTVIANVRYLGFPSCCGISIVHNKWSQNEKEYREQVLYFIAWVKGYAAQSTDFFESVVVKEDLGDSLLYRLLKKDKDTKVSYRFVNNNSGNTCIVLRTRVKEEGEDNGDWDD